MVQDQILLTDCFSFLTVPRPYHQLESLLLLHLIIFFIFVSFCASSLTLTATKYVLKQCFMFSISDLTKWDRKSDQTVVGELHTSIFPAVAILNHVFIQNIIPLAFPVITSLFSNVTENTFNLLLLFLEKWERGKFQPQKLLMNISEKNKTKAMHWITFRASDSVNGKGFICCYDNSDVSKWQKINI